MKLIALFVHRKMAIFFDHSRLGLGNKFLPNKRSKLNPVTHLHCRYLIRLIHSLSNHSVGETMEIIGYPRDIIICSTGGSLVAANLHVAFLFLKGRPEQKLGRSFCVSKKKLCSTGLLYFTSISWRQIWCYVLPVFLYISSEENSAMPVFLFFYIKTSNRIARQIALIQYTG